MCRDCGCQEANFEASRTFQAQSHSHGQGHERGPFNQHSHPTLILDPEFLRTAKLQSSVVKPLIPIAQETRRIELELSVLAKNNGIASRNRTWFESNKIRVLNMMSSPGSGKALLLEKTIQRLKSHLKVAILTGDQERDFDAQRLLAQGASVKQLNTLSSCHLDASMIERELGAFVRPDLQLLIIENVGNLVCPAAFDLGEGERIALLSTPEGEDKPAKYPALFQSASLILITKTDLIPHLDWNFTECEKHIRNVNPHAQILLISAKTGEGLDAWIEYLLQSC